MPKQILTILLLLAVFGPTQLFARDAEGVVELRSVPAKLDSSRAYILFRSSRAKTGIVNIEHVFLRIPTPAEVESWAAARKEAYEAALPKLRKAAKGGPVPAIDEFPFEYAGPDNTFASHTGSFLVDGADIRTFLLEVPAGDYVIYGVSAGGRALITCNCLGTVRFEARPGVITNIGSLYADKVHSESLLPYLEDNVGPSMFRYGWIMGQALVPPTAGDLLPDALRALPVELAQFRVVGLFHDRTAQSINRLAPIPGILDYDHGKVIDVATGTVNN